MRAPVEQPQSFRPSREMVHNAPRPPVTTAGLPEKARGGILGLFIYSS